MISIVYCIDEIWLREWNLTMLDKAELLQGRELTDKHMNATSKILAKQFPEMPRMQNCLLVQNDSSLTPAQCFSICLNFVTSIVTIGLCPTSKKKLFLPVSVHEQGIKTPARHTLWQKGCPCSANADPERKHRLWLLRH